MLELLPHAHAVASGQDLLLLDVRNDGYSILPGAISSAVNGVGLAPIGVVITPDAAAALLDAALAQHPTLVVPDASAVARLTLPTRRLDVGGGGRLAEAPLGLLDLIVCIAQARRRLRRGMPFAEFSRTRSTRPLEVARLDQALRSLAAARLLVPVPDRCLPASLVCALFLGRRGIRAEVVFGVRTHPFMAHCWTEVGGLLVNDDMERVSAYLPIATACP